MNKKYIYGYAVGNIGESITYNFVNTYFVVYMTNNIGMSMANATTIMSVALYVEVIAGMLFGHISDMCTMKFGRRRPFILISGIVMLPILVIMFCFANPEPVGIGAMIYYFLISIIFRVAYVCYEVPGTALGSEITTGYDDRTRLRSLCRYFTVAGYGMGTIGPLIFISLTGSDSKITWQFIGIFTGLIATLSWIVSFFLTKEIKPARQTGESLSLSAIVKSYIEILKLKAIHSLVLYKAAFTVAHSLFSVATIHYLKYCIGLDTEITTYLYVLTIVVAVFSNTLIKKSAIAFGKVKQQKIFFSSAAVLTLAVYLWGGNSIWIAVIYMLLFTLVQESFRQISSAIFYDIVDVDYLASGRNREGDIMSLVSVLGTVLTALTINLYGAMSTHFGFNPSTMAEDASIQGYLSFVYLLVPAVCFMVAAITLHFCPLTRKSVEAAQEAAKLRDEGKSYEHLKPIIDKII